MENTIKLASAVLNTYTPVFSDNSFSVLKQDIDTFSIDNLKTYREVVDLSRFFYKKDPIASTVINKFVEIAINDLYVVRKNLTQNEYKVYYNILKNLKDFLEQCALEYLISGMAIVEYNLGLADRLTLKKWNIRKIASVYIPTDLWVRDSSTIIVNRPFVGSKSTYYIEVPPEVLYFIRNKGTYANGSIDKQLYDELARNYPEFVKKVLEGNNKIPLENPIIIERRKLSNSSYPIPFLYPALESLKYKRNLRKMDYSLASRVISAILLVKMGNDQYPLLEDDSEKLLDIKNQLTARDRSNNYDKLYQLFGNHTLNLEWVMPDVSALLSESKYKDINNDIFFALGFPRILVTGETERSNSSDPEYAILSPIKTIENLREKLSYIIEKIFDEVYQLNNFENYPVIKFKPINLNSFIKYFGLLLELYNTGNLSRTALASELGFDIEEELDLRKQENDLLAKNNLESFAPLPHSNTPENKGTTKDSEEVKNE